VDGQRHDPAALPPGKGPGARFIESLVVTRDLPHGCEKCQPYRDSILGPNKKFYLSGFKRMPEKKQ
jgi:hypothetical protein